MLERTLSADEREVASVVLRGAGAHRIPGMGIHEGADLSARKVVGLGAWAFATLWRGYGQESWGAERFRAPWSSQPEATTTKRGASGGDDQRCVRLSSRIATP
jgi:hypothetical protein